MGIDYDKLDLRNKAKDELKKDILDRIKQLEKDLEQNRIEYYKAQINKNLVYYSTHSMLKELLEETETEEKYDKIMKEFDEKMRSIEKEWNLLNDYMKMFDDNRI